MSRTLSFAALSTLLLATAVEASDVSARNADGYRGGMDTQPTVPSHLAVATDAAALLSDNCSVDGYPWLSADGQPVEG